MYRAKRGAGVVLGLTLLAFLGLEGSALGQGTGSRQLQLTPSRNSRVSGTAIFVNVESGLKVELNAIGLPEAGVRHISHIHEGGTCADDRAGRTAPVTIPLRPVVAEEDGTGSAITNLEGVTVAELFDESKESIILLHAKTEKGQGVPPGIACADLLRTSANAVQVGDGAALMRGGTTVMDSGNRPLPESGGLSILLPAGALLLGSGVLTAYAMRRRS